ncbi:cell wall hydrolase [Brevundimonas goettingensis]|uniref:Cell wall hydrolase n=1 Tax=Brevundimonas goettingensis TaxID=2774190 RepID=A0A975C1V4_9CAUL|nr:cell wall hydrolase [Brevundimonas goettingensis]QTC92323.1 cell wall hydrolase [Brevundimonas goettingensis]
MSLDTNLPDEPFARPSGPLTAFLNRLSGLRYQDLAPSLLAWFGCALIVVAAVTLVLTQRLAQIQQQTRSDAGPAVHNTRAPLSGPLTPDEFTLAPDAVRQLDALSSQIFNDSIPFSDLPIQPARPFIMSPTDIVQYSRAVDCMTAAIYYEAGNETPQGQAAVAQVVLNRMRHPAYPNTICGVIFQGQERSTGCQFSFTCDGAMNRPPNPESWARAKAVATAALNGSVAAEVGMATHYHADYVSPYWAERLVKLRKIGVHIFYRWTGAWGQRFSFTRQHTGEEPVIAKMALVTTPLDALEVPVDPNLVPEPQIEVDTTPLIVAPVQHAPLPEPEPQAPPPPTQAAPPPTPAPTTTNPWPRRPSNASVAAASPSRAAGSPPTKTRRGRATAGQGSVRRAVV